MTPDQAIKEARELRLRPMYLVLGEETHLASSVVRALSSAALHGGVPGLNEDQLTAGEADIDSVLGAARTLPMLGARRLVCVRSIERWEPRAEGARGKRQAGEALDRLAEYAKSPAPSTVLLLVGTKLDNRRRLVALAKQEGWLVSCQVLSRSDLPAWIERSARERGNTLAPEVSDLIAELAGPELACVADALERVCLYAGASAEVTADHVAECVVRLRPATVWALVAAVGRRDLGGALSALSGVFDPADRGLRLVGVLAWSARQMLRFESALRAGLAPADAAKSAGAPPFKARELTEQVKRIPRAQLENWLELLAAVDFALKGGSRRTPKAVLEEAIVSLCTSRRDSAGADPPRAPA